MTKEDKSERQQQLEDLYTNLDDVKSSSSALAGNVANILRGIVFDYNDKVRERLRDWLTSLSVEEKEQLQEFRDKFDGFFGTLPRGLLVAYTDEVSVPAWGPLGTFGSVLHQGVFDRIDEQLENVFNTGDVFGSVGATPYGLIAKNGPLARGYDECVKKGGTQVWDRSGWWRCLFPNSVVPQEMLKLKNERFLQRVLTKDDLEQEMAAVGVDKDLEVIDLGPKGVFFRHFEGLLKWKQQNWITEQEKQNRLLEEQKNQNQELWVSPHSEQPLGFPPQLSYIVLSLVLLSYVTNPDTNKVEWVEKKEETTSEGRKTITETRKERLSDGSDWTLVDEKVSTEDGQGWFWSK